MDLKPLNLAELNRNEKAVNTPHLLACMLCDESLDVSKETKSYLSHLLITHFLVISDVDKIGDLERYAKYWRARLEVVKIEDICFKINTNTGKNDLGETETYFFLCENLPEDRELREKLNIYKLEKALKQQELERNDQNFFKTCFFCSEIVGNNRSNILNHMHNEHNFGIGNPDNIVYFDDFYKTLNDRFENLQCFFCEKIFYDKRILKEHMRKKQHKSIDPNNKNFDRFYIINYLEYSKVWHDIKSEKDIEVPVEPNDQCDKMGPSIEDWNDPVQTYFCLFCEKSFETEEEILEHMCQTHKFDLKLYMKKNNFSFHNQIKFINYIRQQIFLKNCFVCNKNLNSRENLLSHLEENEHINQVPETDFWDQPEFYFPTFEDDSLLCLLDDDAYDNDELKVQVIPEILQINVNEEILKNFKDLKF